MNVTVVVKIILKNACKDYHYIPLQAVFFI